ncbi:MAG: phospholipid/cholesterol/gamma-HCH transport system substrate-binding protein [Thermoleophilaceae bacterium]|nr:phospholipid/cholesterol/gamma-HCH transport system substrate-binding protein [Thermoleophilaceae bacterium]
MRSRGTASLAASPVLVGAVTVLVTIVAVFLSYNANTGLPFVPTYDLKANLPNGSQLVKGFEVRIGGARVGQVSMIEPKRRKDGSTYAQITMKLDKQIEPLRADTTLLVRPRSAIGLKYVQLTPGHGSKDLASGTVIPVRQARPAVVELDDLFNMFDDKARVGSRNSINGYGGGLAGRGDDLNRAIPALIPLLRDLEPVASNLAARQTRLGRLFRALGKAASEAAPVAEIQASLFVNLDTTFTALSSIARPYLQESISEGPPSEELAIREFPFQGKFLRNNAAFFRELRPGVATLPHSAPILAQAFEAGTKVLPKTPPMNAQLADVFESLADFSQDPLVRQGVVQLTRLSSSLRPTLAFLAPVQTTCNYATLFFRNAASVLSDGDSNGTWQRFIIVPAPSESGGAVGPNSEISPASTPANGPLPDNHLHTNPYPNTASPGQTRECEAGNERYGETIGRTLIGNQPGNQGIKTEGQLDAKGSTP